MTNENLTKEITDLKTTLKVLRNNSNSTDDSKALEESQQEVDFLKKKLAQANAKISAQCNENPSTLVRNHELVQENSKLMTQCKDHLSSLEKSQQKCENLEEKCGMVTAKLKLQYSRGDLLENQMNILMQEFLPTETEKTFLKLREEFEYLKKVHTSEKEQIETLQVQLSNCECKANIPE